MSMMGVMTVLSSATTLPFVLVPDFAPGILTVFIHCLGLVFAVDAGAALLVTRRAHGVDVAPRAALTAIVSVGVSFPLLFWGGTLLAYPFLLLTEKVHELSWLPAVGAMILSSALGARWVAATLTRLTGRDDRQLRRGMVAWGAAWPLLSLLAQHAARAAFTRGSPGWLLFYDLFTPGTLLAWQLPIGLAAAAWFVRARLGP
ncbi:MAG TPA: hypothetical protein VIF57_18350 [Polyangia bacterium]|jgi:hypothetical protein